MALLPALLPLCCSATLLLCNWGRQPQCGSLTKFAKVCQRLAKTTKDHGRPLNSGGVSISAYLPLCLLCLSATLILTSPSNRGPPQSREAGKDHLGLLKTSETSEDQGYCSPPLCMLCNSATLPWSELVWLRDLQSPPVTGRDRSSHSQPSDKLPRGSHRVVT